MKALHVINSVAAGVSDIPFLLLEQPPPSWEWANLGNQEYGKKVRAVVVGCGYNDAEFEELRRACKGKSSVPWLRHDILRDIDPRQPRPKIGIDYGEQIAKKLLDCLNDLRKYQRMNQDGVYWF